jgi:SPP1 gp7 family putative phage head morphogenesis protein
LRRRNVELIRSVSIEMLDQVESVIKTATAGQLRVEVLKDLILKRFSVSESSATLNARDQTLKANADITRVRQESVGVTHYIWSTSGDERVRDRHADLDGTRQSWLSPPIISEDGRTGHPGEDYQCRCTAIPIVDSLLEDAQ